MGLGFKGWKGTGFRDRVQGLGLRLGALTFAVKVSQGVSALGDGIRGAAVTCTAAGKWAPCDVACTFEHFSD